MIPNEKLRILLVEDSENDGLLVLREIRRGGYDVESARIETAQDMRSALEEQIWDLIVCDFSLPRFSAQSALDILKESGHDLPFIIVSGTIEEQSAVAALKDGAHDFILKEKLARLVPAIQRELKEAGIRRERLQHERELEAIAVVNASMRSAKTLDETLQRLLDQTLELLKTDSGSLWLYHPVVKTINLAVQRGWEQAFTTSVKPGEDLPGLVTQTGEPIISREFKSDERVTEYTREHISTGLGGACVPLQSSETVIGALCVHLKLPRQISTGELRILNAVAEIGGNAIHRMRLHEKTVKQLERLDALRAIDLIISNTMDLPLTLSILLNHIIKQLEVDAVSVLLIKPGSGRLEYVAGQGFYTNGIEHTDLRMGDAFAGQAVLERRTIHVADLRIDHEKYMRRALLAGEEFISYFAIPLIAKGEVKGVMEIFHRSSLNPDPEWLDFLETLGGQTAIAVENSLLFQNLQRSNFELAMAYDATIEGWSKALDLRDKETEGHTQRVTEMTLKLARVMGVNENDLIPMRRGALLHDIGKMGVPDNILLKPGGLEHDEWKIMRMHPDLAHEWLTPISYLKNALEIPYCHHERWDGTGYPRGLKGDIIPLAARIFAVADVWDALTSNRPYREAWPESKVVEYIREQSGTHFDPEIVEIFLKHIPEWKRKE